MYWRCGLSVLCVLALVLPTLADEAESPQVSLGITVQSKDLADARLMPQGAPSLKSRSCVVVSSVDPSGPSSGKLSEGNAIISIDGVPTPDVAAYEKALKGLKPDAEIAIKGLYLAPAPLGAKKWLPGSVVVKVGIPRFGQRDADSPPLEVAQDTPTGRPMPVDADRVAPAARPVDEGRGQSVDARAEIDLTGRTSISDAEAKELAGKPWGLLIAKDVTTISDEAIILLAKHNGGLILRGVPHVSLRAAKALSEHEGLLNIGGATLSDEVIDLLARNRGELGLNVLNTLTPKAAQSLATHHQGVLGLNGLKTLPVEAAKALASHRGAMGIGKFEELSPAVASALARASFTVDLAEHKSFSEETRTALSGHHGRILLSFVELPQYFPPDPGWEAETATGIDARNASLLIDKALAKALGEESAGRQPFSLSGVHLGMHLRDLLGTNITPNMFEDDPTRLLVPAPDDKGEPRPKFPVCVRVDSLTGKIVCVEKVFLNTALDEVVDGVVETFGKTPQDVDEIAWRSPTQVRRQSSLRYTFPEELVRITQIETAGTRGPPTNAVVIWLMSREWTEHNLHRYGNSVLTASDWVKLAIKAFDGDNFDVTMIPPLPGTQRNAALDNTHALFADINHSELLANKTIVEGQHRRGREMNASPIVGAVGKVDGWPVILVCPLNSTVAGFRPISTRDQFGSEPDIRSTHGSDLLKHVANFLVQAEFPPTTEEIAVFREAVSGNTPLRFDGRGGITQLNAWFDRTTGARYEWKCENGWTARVSFEGTICFFRKPQKRID